jgi:organic radical activating enzyme
MHLTWIINNICTNKCSYCPPSLHNGKNHHYDWENARKFFQYLFDRYTSIHCTVAGGEPSLSPFFKEICKIFNNSGHTIGVTSNAAKPAHYWEEVSKDLNYICFSYHPEFSDSQFKEKILAAADNTYVAVRVMMYPKMWDHCIEIYNRFDSYEHLAVEPVRVLNWGGSSDPESHVYSNEQLEWFENYIRPEKNIPSLKRQPKIGSKIIFSDGTYDDNPNTIEYINKGQTNFNGYSCEVGLKSMFIEWNGDIFLGNCMINGKIGNIDNPDTVQWPTKEVICTKNICHCTTDVNINKRLI